MHITILTIGSRGDVQPYMALGVGLQNAGHRVRLATHAEFESEIRTYCGNTGDGNCNRNSGQRYTR